MVCHFDILTSKTCLTARSYRSDNDMYDHMNNSVYYFLYVLLPANEQRILTI